MRILIIEDDKQLCSILEYQLKKNGITADFCYNGDDALFYGRKQTYDIIILDRMLPGMDGLTILTKLRNAGITTPVILLTAMGEVKNRIEGLDKGADDYVTKPFEMEELFARIRALSRRPARLENKDTLYFSDFCLNKGKVQLVRGEESCTLTKRECDLLEFLIRNSEQILTREVLLTRVWGVDSFVTNGNLDNFIWFLRKRLHSVHSHASIKTVRSIGYKLEE